MITQEKVNKDLCFWSFAISYLMQNKYTLIISEKNKGSVLSDPETKCGIEKSDKTLYILQGQEEWG